MKISRKIKIAFPAAMMAAALFLSNDRAMALAAFCAAAVHELGHILCSAVLGIRIKNFSLSLLGARLHIEDPYISYKNEILLCLAGPLANLYSLLLVMPPLLRGYELSDFYLAFVFSSIGLCALNLLPVISFDGGRILYCIIAYFWGPSAAQRTLEAISFFCLFTLWSFSVYILILTGKSLSVFAFSACLFVKLFFSRESEDS